MTTEIHPLEPFLPVGAKVLFLGSFPPPRSKWSMDFFYPNWINDFWRIMGLIFYEDRRWFEMPGSKAFDKERVEAFCSEKGFAFYDSAVKVCRLKDNASDDFLQILEATDIPALMSGIPLCRAIVTTGGKSSEQVAASLGVSAIPPVGGSVDLIVGGVKVTWYRVPSSSRAYPMKIEAKAEYYRKALESIDSRA